MGPALMDYVGVRLTPAHDLRGAARSGKSTVRGLVVPALREQLAAPRLVHALVRRQQGPGSSELFTIRPQKAPSTG
jgi:hypothetical protein